MPRATGGQDGVWRTEGLDLVAVHVQHIGAVAALGGGAVLLSGQLGIGDQVHQHVVLEERDAGGLARQAAQCGLHGGAGGVGGVHDAAVGVAALAGQVQFAVFGGEGHAQFLQPGDGRRSVLPP